MYCGSSIFDPGKLSIDHNVQPALSQALFLLPGQLLYVRDLRILGTIDPQATIYEQENVYSRIYESNNLAESEMNIILLLNWFPTP